jgi:hypothetical protein
MKFSIPRCIRSHLASLCRLHRHIGAAPIGAGQPLRDRAKDVGMAEVDDGAVILHEDRGEAKDVVWV